jgi:ABC-type amino acid transport substrate-binding protein
MRGRLLRAGVFEHTPRMSFVDVHGERTGLCVEVVAMIAERTATTIGLGVLDHIDTAMEALKRGDIDFIAIELTPQEPASAGVRYTDPFCFIDVVAFARSDVAAVHWSDLNRPDVTLMVGESTSYVGFAPRYLPRAKLVVFGRSGLETAGAIARGEAHAGLKDAQLALQFPRVHRELRILEGALANVPVSFVVRADDDFSARAPQLHIGAAARRARVPGDARLLAARLDVGGGSPRSEHYACTFLTVERRGTRESAGSCFWVLRIGDATSFDIARPCVARQPPSAHASRAERQRFRAGPCADAAERATGLRQASVTAGIDTVGAPRRL